MTVFEKINSMDMEEFSEWFENNCLHDTDPSIKWYDKTYCKNCEEIVEDGKRWAYCEINNKCRYFDDMENVPDLKQTIKMWLESEAD